ncbi:MAG: hypothetical protein Q8R57_14160 [Bacteroidota bacterium]|nr:hypothetical protein [Bacteroidota bacterium]
MKTELIYKINLHTFWDGVQETYTLSPLIVSSSKKLNRMKIGVFYKKANRYFIMNPGQEIAVLFHSDTFPSILKSVSFLLNNFSKNNFSHARINVYEFDTITQKPGKILNNSSFFVKNKVLNKLVELDLSANNIVITKPYFCVGVEFVKNESKGIIEKGNVLEPHHLTLGSIKPQLSKHFIREITKDNSFKWSDFNRENLIIGLELKF